MSAFGTKFDEGGYENDSFFEPQEEMRMFRNSYTELCPRCAEHTKEVFRSHSYCANCGYDGDEGYLPTRNNSRAYRKIVKEVDEDMRRLEKML